jgi:hypothetical protein
MVANEDSEGFNERLYLYLRYTAQKRLLVAVNFNRYEQPLRLKLPNDLLQKLNVNGPVTFTDLLSNTKFNTANVAESLQLNLPAAGGLLLEF